MKPGHSQPQTKRHFVANLSDRGLQRALPAKQTIVLFDRRLLKVASFRKFISRFPYRFPLQAGEKLKSWQQFGKEAECIHAKVGGEVSRHWTVAAIGGGSIGDFAGFFASTYKRGLRLVHVPSTWLAAFDSSHGGKTALNLGGAKNQVGTFYEASDVFLVRELLFGQPGERAEDAIGELAKIAMIDGHGWARKLKRPDREIEAWLWKYLPQAIGAKMRIVRRDPFETLGKRQILNLGHTLGHVIEAIQKTTHGRSVAMGLRFAVEMSVDNQEISRLEGDKFLQWLDQLQIPTITRPLPAKRVRALLRTDKKREAGDRLQFILMNGWGRPVRKEVSVERILKVASRIGWVK